MLISKTNSKPFQTHGCQLAVAFALAVAIAFLFVIPEGEPAIALAVALDFLFVIPRRGSAVAFAFVFAPAALPPTQKLVILSEVAHAL
jgi:hypothetical protein